MRAVVGLAGFLILGALAVWTWRQGSSSPVGKEAPPTTESVAAPVRPAKEPVSEKDLDRTGANLEEAIRSNPNDSAAHHDLGLVLLQKGDSQKAAAEFRRALELDPKQADAAYRLANILAQRGEADDALLFYDRALQAQPDLVHALTGAGNILLGRNEIDAAIPYYEKAVKLDSEDPTAQYNLGAAFFRKNELDQAIAHFEKAIAAQPNYPDAEYFLGNALLQKRQVKQAIAHWERSVRVQPDNAIAANDLAWLLATSPDESLRDGDKAIDLAKRAIATSPDPIFLRTLAAAYAEKGDFARAIETAEKAVKDSGSLGDAAAFKQQMGTDIDSYLTRLPLRDLGKQP